MSWTEVIAQAFRAIRANLLRAFLTLMIIAVGIMALVGILTALDAIIFNMSDSFSSLGANSFVISPSERNIRGSHGGRRELVGDVISFKQANDFKEKFQFPARVSISMEATGSATVEYQNNKTNPTVSIQGIDENTLAITGYEIELGRGFSQTDVTNGNPFVIIGRDIVKDLFKGNAAKALNKVITINNNRFTVVGVLKSKGSSMNTRGDRIAFIPLLSAKRYYGGSDQNYKVTVGVASSADIDLAIEASIALMRKVRGLKAYKDNDFEIFKSDSLVEILKDNTVKIRMATIGIGLITLLGAAIGLVNIMLVSVTERTREIGICKALGATRRNILLQFLTEAILICQLGGALGIILGILVGNVVTIFTGGRFLVPWGWITLGVFLCLAVGLAAGIYPALKASRLDPIESLRYE